MSEIGNLYTNSSKKFKENIKHNINQIPREEILNALIEFGTQYLEIYAYTHEKVVLNVPEKQKEYLLEGRKKIIKTYLRNIDWVFQMCRERAKELKIDVSEHPETLEELTK